MIGCFAKSIAGHDKGRIYVIIGSDDENFYLADGILRTVDAPKKKRKKHVQIIKKDRQNIDKNVSNEVIKRAIKLYGAEPVQEDENVKSRCD